MSESLIAAVKRLAELEPTKWAASPEFFNEAGDWIVHGVNRNRQPKIAICRKEDAIYIADRLNAAQKMLEVLSLFQAGDAKILQLFLSQIDTIAPRDFDSEMSKANYEELKEVLMRMQKAALSMEATQ
ncbi:MAG: hypothetical protein WC455_12915 [Dehalococcoidia bacterium]|jgi:hypothetical protein